MIRQIVETTEIPPRTFHPTHVNRRGALLDEAFALTEHGVTVDVTAFPPEFATSDEVLAADALIRAFDAGLSERVTVSSDGGGCLPEFDRQGALVRMDFATSAALANLLADLLDRGVPLENALLPFTRTPARLLRLSGKGEIAVGNDADLVVLDTDALPSDVMVRGRWHVRCSAPVVRGTFDSSGA